MKTLDEVLDHFDKDPATKLFPEVDINLRKSYIRALYPFVYKAASKHLSLEAYAVGVNSYAPEVRFRGKIGIEAIPIHS